MIARGMEIVDIEPAGYENFLDLIPVISPVAPRAVLWHDEGMALRMTLDGQHAETGLHAVSDARESAARIFARLAGRARQVVVTDRSGYRKFSSTLNLVPRPGELKYEFQDRLNQALIDLNGESFAIYPEPGLDRGPVVYRELAAYFGGRSEEAEHVVLGVFDRGRLFFSFVARMTGGLADLVTSFDHWPEIQPAVEFSAESLDGVVQTVERSGGPVACALFIDRADLERLYDGNRHDTLPGSLIVGGKAFGISNMPGVAERAFLACAGLFAYVPLCLPSV